MKKSIIWLWLIFACLFLALSVFHFINSGKKITHFSTTEISQRAQLLIDGVSIEKPLKDFVKDFNLYIDSYNKSTSRQNRLAGIGYLFASLTAFFSMWLAKHKNS